jgi:hypothetical protein
MDDILIDIFSTWHSLTFLVETHCKYNHQEGCSQKAIYNICIYHNSIRRG